MKPGYMTTEFWSSIVSQALALLMIVGVISASDAQTLGDSLGKCIAAVFVFATNAYVVAQYIKGRVTMKTTEQKKTT